MLRVNEIVASLKGAFALAVGQASGLARFEQSFEAFWRSFAAIFLVAPLYLMHVLAEHRIILTADDFDPATFSAGLYFSVKAFVLIIDWFAFPILMVFLARLLRLTAGYGLYITVFNWGTVLIVAALTPPFIGWSLGYISDFAANIMSLGILMIVLRYRWFIARVALEASPLVATGLVLAEFLLSLLITQSATRLIGLQTGY